MKIRLRGAFLGVFFVSVFAGFMPCGLAAKGKADTSDAKPLNTEWKVVITRADASALPPSRASVATYWNRELERSIRYVRYRSRDEDEMDFYKNNEWLRAQTAAAKAVKAKQTERDNLYYQGLEDWRYRRQIKKIDTDMQKLRETLEKAEESSPVIERLPKFTMETQDGSGEFPEPPKKGGEYNYCVNHKSDAFIVSTISLYYERIYIELKLWAMYAKTYVYTDSIIFSLEDMNEASDEIIERFIDGMSGVYPTAIAVATKPENAVIVIDEEFAGQGKSGSVLRSPGEARVMAFAPGYETATATVPLTEGERADVSLALSPIPSMGFDVEVRRAAAASVYSGALYTGEAPVRIEDNEEKNMTINVVTAEGKTAGAVFKNSEKPVVLTPKTPPPKGRVEKARKGFYGAWGRFWIIVPLTWFAVGISDAYVSAYNGSAIRTQEQADRANTLYWGAGGAGVLAGIFLAESLGRFIWYGYQAARPSTPLDK